MSESNARGTEPDVQRFFVKAGAQRISAALCRSSPGSSDDLVSPLVFTMATRSARRRSVRYTHLQHLNITGPFT
jgi:hypothetical protein